MPSLVKLISCPLLLLAISTVVHATETTETHYETYTFITNEAYQNCIPQSRKSCTQVLWGLFGSCKTENWIDCFTSYRTALQIGQKCQTGWTGSACNIPVCRTPCIDGKVCTAPDTCRCVSTGDGCQSVPCDATNNCYPGTCIGGNCICQAGFSGPNCLKIEQVPDISKCSVQLSYNDTSSQITKEFSCAPSGFSPEPVWINAKSLKQVEAKWTADYVSPFNLPAGNFVPHVQFPAPIGVADTFFSISSQGTGSSADTKCSQATELRPLTTVNCDQVQDWNTLGITPRHNQTFNVTVTAKLGGYKEGSNSPLIPSSNFQRQIFVGLGVTRQLQFMFDLQPPVHCLSFGGNDCPLFAIFLEQDITTDATIEPKFYNWTDDGSGILTFQVEIYRMQAGGSQNLLVNAGTALKKADVDPARNNFVYTCTISGVYSIELTVLDAAGNAAKARKLFIFNENSKLKTNPDNPVFIEQADPKTEYKWITKFDNPRNGGIIPLTLTWTNHFSSNARFDGSWGLAAEPWTNSKDIDDIYDRYGRRSIKALTDIPTGIVSYGVAFYLDKAGGGKGLVPENWMFLNATVTAYPLPGITNLTDGDTLVVWIQCNDVAGGSKTEQLTVSVDKTPPEIKNASFSENGVDDSTSSVSIITSDKGSGIKQISYAIFDSKLRLLVRSGSSQPQKRDPPSSSRRRRSSSCASNDASCYCTPAGDCYNYAQTVEIDNCWLDRLAGHTFEFRYNVTNQANISSSEQTLQLGVLSLHCRPPLSSGAIAGIVIGSILGALLLFALVVVIILLVRIYIFKKPVPRRLKTIRTSFGRPHLDENIAYQTAADVSQWNNTQISSTNNNLGRKEKKINNKDEVYAYSDSSDYMNSAGVEGKRGGGSGGGRFLAKDVQLGKTISEGRFAIVKEATLVEGNERKTVATKGLISGASESDRRLLTEKIQFMNQVPTHINLVKFLGTLEEDKYRDPIMIMEYCDMSLKDWLTNLKAVTSDDLENMLTFTYNIANGVKHLHSNEIVHRRLGARNVLLQQHYGGLLAKLIGFGPNKEDMNGEKTSLPIKWFAPETLETLNSGSPTHNKQTDVWSFGITIWEIYSKGSVPYPDVSNSDAKRQVREKQLTPSHPEDCPPDLFDAVLLPCWNFSAVNRPSMADICSSIDTFRRGIGLEPEGYYTSLGDK